MPTVDDLISQIQGLSAEQIAAQLRLMPPPEFKRMKEAALAAAKGMCFIPNPGAQTQAYQSQADILLYGGAASGGKTALMLGVGIQQARSGIIFRRESNETDGLEKTGAEFIANTANYNGTDKEWTWTDGRTLKLAGMKEPDDWRKHAGRERDFIGFDEAGEFLELQVRSIMGWMRGPKGRRCRMILATNPPRSTDGFWLKQWFAPWLRPDFPNPAQPGELRWGVFVDTELIWCDGPQHVEINGEMYAPRSFTFIPAKLADNPYRNTAEYRSTLQSLPEPLRSQLLYGDFNAGTKDGEFQLIPSEWLRQAQERWTQRPPEGIAMTAMGFDPAGGGEDAAALAMRYGGWFAPLVTASGAVTSDGSANAALIVRHRRDGCPVIVDVGGGYGGATTLRLKDNLIDALGFNGANAVTSKTKDGKLTFANKRSEAYWRFREELDPSQEGGSVIALPPDPELIADLAAPTWALTARGIQVESKIIQKDGKIIGGLRKKLGRSPGKGDAVVMCLSEGSRAAVRMKSIGSGPPRKAESGTKFKVRRYS